MSLRVVYSRDLSDEKQREKHREREKRNFSLTAKFETHGRRRGEQTSLCEKYVSSFHERIL